MPIQHQVFPIYRIRQTPLSPSSTNSNPPYIPYIRPTQLYSNQPDPTPTRPDPTRPDPRPYHYPTNRHTLPPPNQTHSHTSIRPSYPTTPTPYIIVPSKPSPLLPLYAHPAATTLISPSKAHMSYGRFCCALTIEYKCKTLHINKHL